MFPDIDELDNEKTWSIPFDMMAVIKNEFIEKKFNDFIERAKKRFNVLIEFYNGNTVPYDVITLEPKKE